MAGYFETNCFCLYFVVYKTIQFAFDVNRFTVNKFFTVLNRNEFLRKVLIINGCTTLLTRTHLSW